MEQYISFIRKHRKRLLVLLVLINLFAIAGIFQVKLSSDFQIFTPTVSVYKDKIEEMDRDFPSSDQLIIQIETDETLVSESTYRSLYELYTYITETYGNINVTGPVTREFTESSLTQLTIQMELLGDLSPSKEVDGKIYHSYTLFSEGTITHKELVAIEDTLKSYNFNYAISGNTYMQLKVLDYIVFILTRIPPLAFLTILFVFNLKIRSIKGTILSVLPAGLGALWTLGIVGWLGEPVSILTVLAPIFTIVIGSADGLHFIAHVQEEQSEHGDTKRALSKTLKMVGVPMIITTVTSMAGFLSLLVMRTEAIKGLAIFASIGILLAGIATWYVLPLILTGDVKIHNKAHIEKPRGQGLRRFWGWPSIAITLIVIVIFALGVGSITQEFNMLSIYKDKTEVNQNNEAISKVNGGTLPVFVYGDIPEGLTPIEVGQSLLAFEDELRGLDGIGRVVSAYDFMEKLQGSQDAVQLNPTLMNEFVNLDAGKFKMMVFPSNHENGTLRSLDDFVMEYGQDIPDYNLKVTGVGFMMMELNENMLMNQIASSLLAIIIVFLLLLMALKHIKSALISLVPILLTLLILFGFLGLSGTSLNIITCTIFSITIGVGIDYAIHFTSIWRTRVAEGMTSMEAADSAYYYTARPITANAFGLSLGFSALFLSPLQIHVTVATLMWVSMMTSVVFSLIILPSLLRRVK